MFQGLGGDLSIKKVKTIPPMDTVSRRTFDSTVYLKNRSMDGFTSYVCMNRE